MRLSLLLLVAVTTVGCGEGPGGETVAGRPGAVEPDNVASPTADSNKPRDNSRVARYEPRVSERRYLEFMEGLSPEEHFKITEEQVLAYMGEPTHREPPISGTKQGYAFTLEVLHWKVPGSGVESTVNIVNGLAAGQTIGLETGKARSRP